MYAGVYPIRSESAAVFNIEQTISEDGHLNNGSELRACGAPLPPLPPRSPQETPVHRTGVFAFSSSNQDSGSLSSVSVRRLISGFSYKITFSRDG